MDLNTIDDIVVARHRDDLAAWRPGDAWLAGGTWLFSEPQPALRRLIDLSRLGWRPHDITPDGLSLAATCTIAELDRLECPPSYSAAPLIGQCCRALLGSFKIWTVATVGGNLCLALPAGPMIALTVALDGTCVILTSAGDERRLEVTDFVLGPQATALATGEVLRSIDLPVAALKRRTAFRQVSLSRNGRSGALLIGTRDIDGSFALTVTASVRRPVKIVFKTAPDAAMLRAAIGARIPDALYYDDVHGAPDWRRHMTFVFAEEIRRDLAEAARP